VQGLEYLRRARDFRDHGLTVELRGYQHVVLLEWRELKSTETHPWDRLCDSLNGAGVYSVDEALTQLRLQPLVDAVHRTITGGNIHAFSRAAHEFSARQRELEEKARQRPPVVANHEIATKAETPADGADAGLGDFLEGVRIFSDTARYLWQSEATPKDAAAWEAEEAAPLAAADTKDASYAAIAAAAVHLDVLVLKFPEALQTAARSVLPSNDVRINSAHTWAPVLGWIAFRALPSPAMALAIYDGLKLRHALAETFSAVGVGGEQAWRAAAQVRVLLRMKLHGTCSAAVRSADFWSDGDVRWLTGTYGNAERGEYFDPEKFEAFACWLQLPELTAAPSLRAKAANDAAAVAANLAYAARVSSYDVRRFLDYLHSANIRERRIESEEVATTFSEGRTV
jgi:hypothetical protein